MSTEYFAGFFDGEGSVGLYAQEHSANSIGWKVQPQIVISQWQPEQELHEKLLSLLDENDITYNFQQQSSGKSNIRIQSRSSIVKLWELIGNHLVVKKEELRIMAEEIVPMLNDGKHLKKEGFLEVMQKKEKLDQNKSSSATSNRKYDYEYFDNEFR